MMPVNNRPPIIPPAAPDFAEEASSSDPAAANKTKSHEEYRDIWQAWLRDAPCGEERARYIASEKLWDCLRQHSDILGLYHLPFSTLPELPVHVKFLTLTHSRVTTLPQLPLCLEELDISDNPLTELPDLPGCLKTLKANNNSLTQLPALPADLKSLHVACNKLSALPVLPANLEELMAQDNSLTAVSGLPDSLRKLNLNNNNLTALPVLSNSLTNLSASHNQLTELPRSLPDFLESIDLSFNQITQFSGSLPNLLENIDLSFNQITEFSGLLPSSLWYLNLSSNQITEFSGLLPSSLERLNLSSNQITEFSSLLPSSLYELNLSSNQITEFSGLLPSTLHELDLSSNQITEFSGLLPSSLHDLNLSFNQITEFSSLLPSSLHELDLSSNQITEFPGPLPSSLRYIRLEDNRLSRLPESVMSLHYNCMVDVSNNPLPMRLLRTLQNIMSDFSHQRPSIYFSVNDRSGVEKPERPLYEVVAIWLSDESDREEKWRAIANEENARTFSAFLNRLADTASAQKDPAFKQKMVEWLTMLAQSPGLRELTFSVAFGATATCEDRVSYAYNEMQKLALVQRVENGEFDNKFSELVAVGRVMFRLDHLEESARNKVKTLRFTDEIEVFLAFQTMLRDNLALPLVAKEMRFFNVSGVTGDDLKNAEINVKKAENSIFSGWFSHWTPWHKVLERTETTRWQQAIEAKDKAFEEDYPRRVARALSATRLTGDADAERIVGKKVMEEINREIFTALTREVLTARNMASLINWQWELND